MQASAQKEKIDERRGGSMYAGPQIATQKLMRDPWEKPAYAKSSRVSEPVSCDSFRIDPKVACFYW